MAAKPTQGQCTDKPDYRVSPEQHPLVNTVVTERLPAHTILPNAAISFTSRLVQLQSPASQRREVEVAEQSQAWPIVLLFILRLKTFCLISF